MHIMLDYENILDSGQLLGEKETKADVWGRAQELERGRGN